MADAQAIFLARKNGERVVSFGQGINVDRVVDLLVGGAQPGRHPAIRRNANRLLEVLAQGSWRLAAGPHVGGFGGGGRGADWNMHITLTTRNGGFHLRQDARGHLFEITGPGMDAIPPYLAPGS